LNAEQYLVNHWIKNKIWTHLAWPKHQARLRNCAVKCEGETFADVGCGLGHSTYFLASFKLGAWTGIEFFETATLKAQRIPKFKHINFLYCEDVSELGLMENQFDSVVCSEVIEHVENDKLLIDGLVKMAKKKVIITTPSKRVNDPGHLRLYTAEMFIKLLDGYSYRIDSTLQPGFFYVEIMK
jgi:2-polyprenyl-3-methyl-5-hydroxy-6-metoxy-1,4-benzoquinol methylase